MSNIYIYIYIYIYVYMYVYIHTHTPYTNKTGSCDSAPKCFGRMPRGRAHGPRPKLGSSQRLLSDLQFRIYGLGFKV